MASNSVTIPFFFILALLFAGFSSSDLDKDKAECADKLVGLVSCLPYVGGDAKAPTLDCCTGLKKVVDDSKKCLCVLLKDRDDPNLGFKLNSSLALALPSSCHIPFNITQCIDILHLPPDSKDAMSFQGAVNTTKGNTTTPSTDSISPSTGKEPSSEVKNGGGRRRKLVEMEMIFGVLIWVFTLSLL